MEKQELPDSKLGLYFVLTLPVTLPIGVIIELALIGLVGSAWHFCVSAWSGG